MGEEIIQAAHNYVRVRREVCPACADDSVIHVGGGTVPCPECNERSEEDGRS